MANSSFWTYWRQEKLAKFGLPEKLIFRFVFHTINGKPNFTAHHYSSAMSTRASFGILISTQIKRIWNRRAHWLIIYVYVLSNSILSRSNRRHYWMKANAIDMQAQKKNAIKIMKRECVHNVFLKPLHAVWLLHAFDLAGRQTDVLNTVGKKQSIERYYKYLWWQQCQGRIISL